MNVPASTSLSSGSLVSKLFTVANSLQQWGSEYETLSALTTPTAAQRARMIDLRTSLEIYEEYVGELDELPTYPCITKSNKRQREI